MTSPMMRPSLGERTRLLLLNAAVWTVVAVITVVFVLIGKLPWDGYAHLPWWLSAILGLLLGGITVGWIRILTKDD